MSPIDPKVDLNPGSVSVAVDRLYKKGFVSRVESSSDRRFERCRCEGGKRQLMIAALRYYDTFVMMDGSWLFAERLLYVDWLEERALS